MTNIIRDVWNHLKTWQKVLSIVLLVSIIVILILVALGIIKPVWVLWSGFVILMIILMIKKEIRF